MMIGFEVWKACIWSRNFTSMMAGDSKNHAMGNNAYDFEQFLSMFEATEEISIGNEKAKCYDSGGGFHENRTFFCMIML